jgi:hypothetical protein
MAAMTTNASIAPAVPGAKPKGKKGKLPVPAGPKGPIDPKTLGSMAKSLQFK